MAQPPSGPSSQHCPNGERERTLDIRHESWPLVGRFTISRGSKTTAEVVTVEIAEGGKRGRGECVPYARYGESIDSAVAQVESIRAALEGGMDRAALQAALSAGAARNAVDCALWDLEAKQSGKRAWQLTGLAEPRSVVTAYTLSLDTAENMGAAAKANAHRPLLKLKLAGPEDLDRVRAVHANAPEARLIVDANEGWTTDIYTKLAPELGSLAVEMIEQPLPASDDAALAGIARPIPVCADESAHDRAGLGHLLGKYDAINIKLDKTGGLTEALALAKASRDAGLEIMVGCMVATSLAMAPALIIAGLARWVDLDGPLLLARDRDPGLRFDGSLVHPAPAELWG